jgi:hypothetical protein
MVNPDKKLNILFVSLKWTDATPGRPLSSVHLLMDTLNQSGLGKATGFFCDEHIHTHGTQCDEAFLKHCWQYRPDVLFLFPTQLDIAVTIENRPNGKGGPFYLFPRNDTIKYVRNKLGVPVINAVGDAWGVEAFNRFEGMGDFSDVILLFEPESEFLTMTAMPSKYAILWYPINQKRFDRNGRDQDIPVSFIGRTHSPSANETVSVESPLHQYVYRYHFLQKLIGLGIPVFRAGGAQNAYPLSDDMVSQYIQRSKMTLNFSYHSPNKRLFRGRVWEALSCGAMLLEEDNASIRHFLEPMKHYVPFSDTREAAEKIRFYHSNNAEREAIADEAYRLVHTQFSNNEFWSRCIRLIYA